MMDGVDYYKDTFYLSLTWEDNKVWVQYVDLTWNQNKKKSILKSLSEKISGQYEYHEPEFLRKNNPVIDEILINFGKDIAKLLLPEGYIRNEFIKKWASKNRIRLCLLYPKNDNHLYELLKIPWEYIYLYLPQNEHAPSVSTDNNLRYLLGLRQDISIVHCLNPDQYLNPRPQNQIGVDEPQIEMEYLSWFPEKQEEIGKNIFLDFFEEMPRLKSIIHLKLDVGCINSNSFTPICINAEPADLMIAMQQPYFIHVTSHGDLDKIILKKDESSPSKEIHFMSEVGQKRDQAKAVVLLNCLSGGVISEEKKISYAQQLHQDGVPVVIGMTRSIGDTTPAGRFVDGFYKAVAAWPHCGLERATVEGRKSMFRSKNGRWSKDFGIPRLFLNSPNSLLIHEKLLFSSCNLVEKSRNIIEETAATAACKHVRQSNINNIQPPLRVWVSEGEDVHQRNWFLVGGESGCGKSTQIKLLLDYLLNEDHAKDTLPKILFHLCDVSIETDDSNDYLDASDPLTFVRDSLVPQLVDHFANKFDIERFDNKHLELLGKNYYDWCRPGKFPRLVGNADDALRYFVLEPLRTLKRLNETLDKSDPLPIIIIDGLDFLPSHRHPQNSILHLLLRYRDELDDVARFLITADIVDEDEMDEDSRAMMENIFSLTHHYDGDFDETIGTGEVDNEAPKNSLVLFKEMKEVFHKTFEDFPETPDNEWKKLFQSAIEIAKDKYKACGGQKNKVDRLLDAVVLTCDPIYASDVAAIINLQYDSGEMQELLGILAPFFKEDPNHNTLILYHSRLKKYILRDMNLWNRRTAALTHELFVTAFRPRKGDWAKISNWSVLPKTRWQKLSSPHSIDTMSRYVKRHLSYHAFQSYVATPWRYGDARRRRAEEFLKLICDPGYRTVRWVEVGQEIAVEDLWNGLRVRYTEYIHSLLGNTMDHETFHRLIAGNKPGSYRPAEDFLDLVRDSGYRAVRMTEIGYEATVQDLWDGLGGIYSKYVYSLSEAKEINERAPVAFNRLMAAKEPGSYRRNKLIELERNLRRGKVDKYALWDFLDLPYDAG